VQYLRLLRISQWTKNLLVFAALLFTGAFGRPDVVRLSLLAFLAMGLISSATYVVNDLLDAPKDRLHPEKRKRPLASGEAKAGPAVAIACVCLAGGLAIGALASVAVTELLLLYIALQAAYNLGLRSVPVADVFVVSLGFVLRACVGAAAIDVTISGWLLFCTLALALLLSLGKRRHEFILMGEDRAASRAGLSGYTRPALDALLLMSACCAALCYGVYAIESKTARAHPALVVTTLFVFYGISRYVFLVFAKDEGGEPDVLLIRDAHILFSVILFVAAVVLAMTGLRIPILEGAG
jgi:4-hydroxybenzoate polyprenyltransferase